MKPFIAVHVTEVNVAIKLGWLIMFYCIDPHCMGWRVHRPEKQTQAHIFWFDKQVQRERRAVHDATLQRTKE